MGIGKLGDPNITFKHRKYRYTISGEFPSGNFPEMFVKISGRPNIDHGGIITTTILDADQIKHLNHLSIAESSFSYKNTNNHWLKKNKNKYFGSITLKMYDGYGFVLEEWNCDGVIVKYVNFDDLSYNEEIIEIDWQYKSCSYKNTIADMPKCISYSTSTSA